jgi:hypothetical protein
VEWRAIHYLSSDYYFCMRRNVDSPFRCGDGAKDGNGNEATLSLAPSTLTKDDDGLYMTSPEWRRVDSTAKKTVTFACDVKEGAVFEIKNKTGVAISDTYETSSRLTFVGYDDYDIDKIGMTDEEDELNKETKESGQKLDVTSGDLLSPWKMDGEDETHRRMHFVGHDMRKEGDASAVEEDHDSLAEGTEDELRKATTAVTNDFSITSGDLMSTLRVNRENETHRQRLQLDCHGARMESDALAVEDEEEGLAVDEEEVSREDTTTAMKGSLGGNLTL